MVGTGTAEQFPCSLTTPYFTAPLGNDTPSSTRSPYYSRYLAAATLGTPGSRNNEIEVIHIYRHAAKIIRNVGEPFPNPPPVKSPNFDPEERHDIVEFLQARNGTIPKDPDELASYWTKPDTPRRGEIDHFSWKSKARLKFIAGNCFPEMVSQFLATYPARVAPTDGPTTKKHLDNFLKAVRRKFPGVTYLWILEFQRIKEGNNGSPHYHIFFPFSPNRKTALWLAETWARVIKVEGKDLENVIAVQKRNFIPWNMKKGGYLTKYLEKEYQKQVPPGFEHVGRFWGASQNIEIPSTVLFMQDKTEPIHHADKITGEVITTNQAKDLPRILRKHHESTLRRCGKKRKSRLRNKYRGTTNLPSGGAVINQYLLWYDREKAKIQGINDHEVPF